MPSNKVKNARKSARDAIENARASVENARTKAQAARNATVYTPEGAEEIAGGWVKPGRDGASASLDTARRQAEASRKAAEKALREARSVPESERATAAAVLTPVIAAVATNPVVLVNAYRNRAPNSKADRLVLEEAIQAVRDAGMGDVAFHEAWGRAQSDLAEAVQPPAERQAAEDLQAAAALEQYVASASSVVEGDLEAIQRGQAANFSVSGETNRFRVASNERDLDAGTLDTPEGDGVVDVSALITEEEPEGVSTEYPEWMQPQDTTGIPPSGSAAREPAPVGSGDGGE